VSYVQAIFTGEGYCGVRVSEESLAERRDGWGGKDSHESIIDHGGSTRHPPTERKDGYMLQTLQ